MRHVTVGVIGHVDHGKTALVRALTGVDTDRLEEERRRGISIVLGFAPLPFEDGAVDLVDVPGHERFVRTMVAGATGIEAFVLVVAANEGIRPQTLEHLEIAGLLGVHRGVVAVTKCDLVPAEAARALVEAVEAKAREITGSGPLACVPVSAVTGEGIAALKRELRALPGGPAPADSGLVYLPIDRSFAVAGFGTVVTGTLRRGRLAVGDEVELAPDGGRARVRGLQAHGMALEAADPGRRLAVNLKGVRPAEVPRGAALVTPGLVRPGRWLDVRLRLLPGLERPLPTGAALRLLAGTAELPVRLRLLDREALAPGETAAAQLRCVADVAVPAREPFILRAGSPERTVGGGIVLEPGVGRRRRDAAAAAGLTRLAEASPAEAIGLRLREAGTRGASLMELARLVGHAPERAQAWAKAQAGTVFGSGIVLDRTAHAELEAALLAAVAALHRQEPGAPGFNREQIRAAARTRAEPAIVGEALARLLDRGALARTQGLVRHPSHRPPAALVERAAAASGTLERLFAQAGLMPPDPAAVVGRDPGRLQAVRALLASGRLVRAVDQVQRRELLFHQAAVARARAALAAGFPDGTGFSVGEAGRLLGITRKYSVPLLEHLDAARFTRRDGDRRTVVARPEPAEAAASSGPRRR